MSRPLPSDPFSLATEVSPEALPLLRFPIDGSTGDADADIMIVRYYANLVPFGWADRLRQIEMWKGHQNTALTDLHDHGRFGNGDHKAERSHALILGRLMSWEAAGVRILHSEEMRASA